jgi:hypothetical protein
MRIRHGIFRLFYYSTCTVFLSFSYLYTTPELLQRNSWVFAGDVHRSNCGSFTKVGDELCTSSSASERRDAEFAETPVADLGFAYRSKNWFDEHRWGWVSL